MTERRPILSVVEKAAADSPRAAIVRLHPFDFYDLLDDALTIPGTHYRRCAVGSLDEFRVLGLLARRDPTVSEGTAVAE